MTATEIDKKRRALVRASKLTEKIVVTKLVLKHKACLSSSNNNVYSKILHANID